MIKFFRHIRQSLILENKTSKYFKYAIGEIVLVVIGILIALQINNWNENQKLLKQEQQILFELREELKTNDKAYEFAIKRNNNIDTLTKNFLNQSPKTIILQDSISILEHQFTQKQK